MKNLDLALEELVNFLKDSPMRVKTVQNVDEGMEVIEEMRAKNYRLVASSNTGLKGTQRRLTFLHESEMEKMDEEERSLKQAVANLET